MKTCAECILCLLNRNLASVPPGVSADERAAFLREVLHLIADADPALSTPELFVITDKAYERRFGNRARQDFETLKRVYNERMLALEPALRAALGRADDPLASAVTLARAGNYIDFGGKHTVDDDLLNRLLSEERSEQPDAVEYAHLREELSAARRVVYVADNAGEIVLDKLLIERLMAEYPCAAFTLLVRGEPTLNDATAEDARAVGLADMLPTVGNGNGFPGTVWSALSDEARTLLTRADVIIAKGQANFETLNGCGLNIYYLLLCKCDFFIRRFGVARLTGLFVNERRLPPLGD